MAQPPRTFACALFASTAWHALHVAALAASSPPCGSWQLVQTRCPRGALACSAAWQIAHDGTLAGRCTSAPWHDAHAE